MQFDTNMEIFHQVPNIVFQVKRLQSCLSCKRSKEAGLVVLLVEGDAKVTKIQTQYCDFALVPVMINTGPSPRWRTCVREAS